MIERTRRCNIHTQQHSRECMGLKGFRGKSVRRRQIVWSVIGGGIWSNRGEKNDGKEEETAKKKKRNVNRADVYLLPVERRDGGGDGSALME